MNRAYFQSRYGIDYDQEKREISFGEGEERRTLSHTQRNVLWLAASNHFSDKEKKGQDVDIDAKDSKRLTDSGYNMQHLE